MFEFFEMPPEQIFELPRLTWANHNPDIRAETGRAVRKDAVDVHDLTPRRYAVMWCMFGPGVHPPGGRFTRLGLIPRIAAHGARSSASRRRATADTTKLHSGMPVVRTLIPRLAVRNFGHVV